MPSCSDQQSARHLTVSPAQPQRFLPSSTSANFTGTRRVQQPPSYSMLVANPAGLALLAIFGQTALAAPVADAAAAAPAPDVSKDFMAGVDTSTWVSVQFQGKTITYNPAIVNVTEASASGTSAKRTVLAKRVPCSGNNNENCCGASSFNGTPAPWAWTSDCATIRDWAYAQSTFFDVVNPTGDYHGVVFAGSCAFGAGSWNVFAPYIGSTDIGDVTRDAINIFAVSVPGPPKASRAPSLWHKSFADFALRVRTGKLEPTGL